MSDDKIKSDIEILMDSGLYLETRSIFLDPSLESYDSENEDEIIKRVAIQTVKKIHVLDNYKNGTINIFINNPGGSVVDGMAIYDAINACKNYVRGYVYGEACSMASVILQACDERVLSENSIVMIHDGAWGLAGHKNNVKNWQDFYQKVDQRTYDIYLEKIREKHPNYRVQDLKRRMRDDMIFYGQEAVDIGLADRIVQRGEFNG